MARRIKFTKAALDRFTYEREGQWITDSEVPSLLLRQTKAGGKSYVARWTSKETGARKQETITPYGHISIDEARHRALKLVSQDAQSDGKAKTLADVFGVWHELYAPLVSRRYREGFEQTWRDHLQPAFGDQKLSRITRDKAQAWYNKKRSEKFAPITVNRWVAALSRLFSIARERGWMIGNPLEKLEKSSPGKRIDVFTADDLRTVAQNLKEVEDRYPIGVALLQFLLLYPCRGIEAREMRHADLDLTNGTWTIPAERYKSRKDKVFPLAPLHVAHLKALPRWSKCFVFPSPKNSDAPVRKEYQRKVWHKVRPKPLGAHALRRTIATMMLTQGAPLEHISMLLGHSSVVVTQQAYAHLDPQRAGQYLDQYTEIFAEDIAEVEDDHVLEVMQMHSKFRIGESMQEDALILGDPNQRDVEKSAPFTGSGFVPNAIRASEFCVYYQGTEI